MEVAVFEQVFDFSAELAFFVQAKKLGFVGFVETETDGKRNVSSFPNGLQCRSPVVSYLGSSFDTAEIYVERVEREGFFPGCFFQQIVYFLETVLGGEIIHIVLQKEPPAVLIGTREVFSEVVSFPAGFP
jgi:hypothetical protein